MAARIVYTDLDGTMVGPRGSFWHDADRKLTASPAAALLELHRSGVALVLVSGRTFEQVIEAARIFAADGAIAELGATIAWDSGRSTHRLPGAMPVEYDGRAPMEVEWHVSDKSGRDKFFNIIIEGVNMLASERAEIAAMLTARRGDLRALTADLQAAG